MQSKSQIHSLNSSQHTSDSSRGPAQIVTSSREIKIGSHPSFFQGTIILNFPTEAAKQFQAHCW